MRRAPPTWRLAPALAVLAALCACLPPPSTPGATPGDRLYSVDSLTFEAPSEWRARGDARRIALDAPGGSGRLEVTVRASGEPTEAACLAHAEQSLERGSGELHNVRRHPTTLAGRHAVTQEADGGSGAETWHGWAYAVCRGPVEFRLFFAGPTPVPGPVLEAYRHVLSSMRIAPPTGVARS